MCGPDIQILLVTVELGNGPVEARGVGNTSPGGVDRVEASERVVAGSRELEERTLS